MSTKTKNDGKGTKKNEWKKMCWGDYVYSPRVASHAHTIEYIYIYIFKYFVWIIENGKFILLFDIKVYAHTHTLFFNTIFFLTGVGRAVWRAAARSYLPFWFCVSFKMMFVCIMCGVFFLRCIQSNKSCDRLFCVCNFSFIYANTRIEQYSKWTFHFVIFTVFFLCYISSVIEMRKEK